MPTLSGTRVMITSAVSHDPDPAAAVRELAATLGRDAGLYAAFVAPGYDLDATGRALRRELGPRVIGCTSSGNICGAGYDQSGLSVVALSGDHLYVRTILLGPLNDAPDAVERAGEELAGLRDELAGRDGFALLLTDGLSGNEDLLAASLMAALGDVPILGGSAGDDLSFRHTAVYHDGAFVPNHATVTLVCPPVPFRLLRLQHHEPTDIVLIATDVDPDRRIVRALNGRPAARAYADAIGRDLASITPATYSEHPLLLAAGGASWIRSIAEIRPDGTLAMLARVDIGDVLRVGRSAGMVERLGQAIAAAEADLGSLSGMLVFDCVLRRLEAEQLGLADRVGELLVSHGASGFSTYGEQFNGMHMNQTLVAVAFA